MGSRNSGTDTSKYGQDGREHPLVPIVSRVGFLCILSIGTFALAISTIETTQFGEYEGDVLRVCSPGVLPY